MSDQLITSELLQTMNVRLSECIKKQLECVNIMASGGKQDPKKLKGLVQELEALSSAPLSKALEKADIWRNKLRAAVTSYKVPTLTRDDASQIFDRENTEFRNIYGWSQPADRILQKGVAGYHLYHPLTGRVDPDPILYPYTPKVETFYEQQCVKHITDGKSINMPHTMLSVVKTSEKMGLNLDQCALMLRQIMKREGHVNHDDVKDIEDSVEFMEALIGFFDFKSERLRLLKMLKMCHRKVGQPIRTPVNKYRNLIKDLILLEGIAMTDDEIMEKADREAKKVMFKFLERNTALELKEYLTKKARDEVSIGFEARTNLQELYDNVEKLERVRGYQLQSDKHLVSVDHEVSLFFMNLQEVELDQSDLESMALDVSADCLFHTNVALPPFDNSKAIGVSNVAEFGYGKKDKQIELERPRGRGWSQHRTGKSPGRNNRDASRGASKEREPREVWKDAKTEAGLCAMCGEDYNSQSGEKCKASFCSVYNKPLSKVEERFCMICAKAKKVKAYHGVAWCKTNFERVAAKVFPELFATTLAQAMNNGADDGASGAVEENNDKNASENC